MDEGVEYAGRIDIDLSGLEPLIAIYPSPGTVERVADRVGAKIPQVCVGSCTNSSFENIASFSELLKGQRLAVDPLLYPGSWAVAMQLTNSGYLASLFASGVRVMENGGG